MIGDRDKRDEQNYYQRERIATAAMAAIISNEGNSMRSAESMAETAVYYANALIKELHSGS